MKQQKYIIVSAWIFLNLALLLQIVWTMQIHHLQNYNKILRYKSNSSSRLYMRAKYFSSVYLQHCPCSLHRNDTLYRASWCIFVTSKNYTMKLAQKSQRSERTQRSFTDCHLTKFSFHNPCTNHKD